MKNQIKGFILGLSFALIISNFSFAGEIKESIQVIFNKVNIELYGEKKDVDNILYKGTTYVPIREITQLFNKDVHWNSSNNTANIVEQEYGDNQYGDNLKIIETVIDELNIMAEKLLHNRESKSIELLLSELKSNSTFDMENVYFAIEETGAFHIEPSVQLPDGYEPRERVWYINSKNTGFYVSEIYVDLPTNAEILTVSKAIYNGEQLIGVLGVDIILKITKNTNE